MSDFQKPQVQTNFLDNNGVDLGRKLITKDYLISVYSSIADKLGITPELWMWGTTANGRLGNNITISVNTLTPITTFSGGSDWKQISCGGFHTTAIKTDGTLWTWGYGGRGQLGTNINASRFTPVTTFAGGTDWKQVSAGNQHTMAIKTDGTLWTWGFGSYGELGRVTLGTVSTPITTFAGGTDWKFVSASSSTGVSTPAFSAAIKNDGTLWTWGYGVNGQLGRFVYFLTPVTTFGGGTNWADTLDDEPESFYTLSTGLGLSSAIKTDGTLWAWGNCREGRLGNAIENSELIISTPITTFAGGTNWKQVSCGGFIIATLKTDGTLWTWGLGAGGRLGNASITNRSTPVTTFAGGTDWKQVSAGGIHVAAIKTDGTLWTWGSNISGQLGDGQLTFRSTPVTTFAGGTDWKQVKSGDIHTCAIKTNGTLWIWGNGTNGRLGNGIITGNISTPITTFAGGTDWRFVDSSLSSSTAAIKTDGTLWTWGTGTNGQLGNGQFANRSTPITTFVGGTNWKQVSLSINQTIAVTTTGVVWAWGLGRVSGLGTNDARLKSTPATVFSGNGNWRQVCSGVESFFALNSNGLDNRLFVFGSGKFGELGNSIVTKDNTRPEQIFGEETNWNQITLGANFSSGIKNDGTLWTWGNNTIGQLGNSTLTSSITPVTTFAGGTDWRQVNCAGYGVFAIKRNGTLWGWGAASGGRLGNGLTSGNSSTPITTFAGGTNWKLINSNNNHSLSLKTDGTLWTWGAGIVGVLGINDDTVTLRSTPVTIFAGGTNWKQVSVGRNHSSSLRSTDF